MMANVPFLLACVLGDDFYRLGCLLLFGGPRAGTVFWRAATTRQVGLVGSSGLFLTPRFFERAIVRIIYVLAITHWNPLNPLSRLSVIKPEASDGGASPLPATEIQNPRPLMLRAPECDISPHGLAGLGRSALIPYPVDRIDRPTVCAMTNKAASVLRFKGTSNVQTTHVAGITPLLYAAKTTNKYAMRTDCSEQFWRILADDVAKLAVPAALIWTATASQSETPLAGCYFHDLILSADPSAPMIYSNFEAERRPA